LQHVFVPSLKTLLSTGTVVAAVKQHDNDLHHGAANEFRLSDQVWIGRIVDVKEALLDVPEGQRQDIIELCEVAQFVQL
jgi:hypothetical protein